MSRKIIGSPLDRNNRNNHNDNYTELFKNDKSILNIVGNLVAEIEKLVLESGGDSNAEVVHARGEEKTLKARLDKTDKKLTETDAKKVDKDGSGQVDWANLSQDARENISGDKVAVVGKDSVSTENIVDNSVTFEKTDFANEVSLYIKNLSIYGDFKSGTKGIAEGWMLLGKDRFPHRVENNTQYWTPDLVEGSATLSSYTTDTWRDKVKKGHKYYVSFEHNNIGRLRIFDTFYSVSGGSSHSYGIYTFGKDNEDFDIRLEPDLANVETYVKNFILIDLTQSFGVGNEPSEDKTSFILGDIDMRRWKNGRVNLVDASENPILMASDLGIISDLGENVETSINQLGFEIKSPLKNNITDPLFSNINGFWRFGLGTTQSVENDILTVKGAKPIGITEVRTPVDIKKGNRYIVMVDYMNYSGDLILSARKGVFNRPSSEAFNIFSLTEYQSEAFKYINATDDALSISFRKSMKDSEELEIGGLSVVDLSAIFGKGNEPSAKEIDNLFKNINKDIGKEVTQKEFAKSLYMLLNSKADDGDKETGVYEDSKKTIVNAYENSIMKLENEKIKEEVELLKRNALSIFNARMDKPSESQTINLWDKIRPQKLLMHLHKRKNDGYNVDNDIFLPNAEKGFSDIRITSDSGEVLPYRANYKTDEFDIVKDDRLGPVGDSKTVITQAGDYIKVIKSKGLSISTDKGRSWELLDGLKDAPTPHVNFITQDNTLIFTEGSSGRKVYRSEYPYTSYTVSKEFVEKEFVTGRSVVQYPSGELFMGKYQYEYDIKIYKSVDDGKSWIISADWGDAYQHVHTMYLDTHSSPMAMYAGLDGGGGIIKTVDKGENWIDLRDEYPNIPEATDYGVRYADPLGYRFMGGETPVVGGYSIIKTTEDDTVFTPVLSSGISANYHIKKKGRIFTSGSGGRGHRVGQILVSEDEGESWESAHTTSQILGNGDGVNEGYRYMMNDTETDEILVGSQGSAVPELRIINDGSYAEILIDVPANTTSVTVESGYAYTNQKPIYNDTEIKGNKIVDFNLNENGSVVKDTASGEYYEGNYEWFEIGKHLAHIYPYVTSPIDRWSIDVRELKGFEVDSSLFEVGSKGITISFWAKFSPSFDNGGTLDLFTTDKGDVIKLVGTIGGPKVQHNGIDKFSIGVHTPHDAMYKYDVSIDSEGNVKAYNNGHPIGGIRKYDSTIVLEAIDRSNVMNILIPDNIEDELNIQHFSIREGVIDSKQALQEFNSFVTNNTFSINWW